MAINITEKLLTFNSIMLENFKLKRTQSILIQFELQQQDTVVDIVVP